MWVIFWRCQISIVQWPRCCCRYGGKTNERWLLMKNKPSSFSHLSLKIFRVEKETWFGIGQAAKNKLQQYEQRWTCGFSSIISKKYYNYSHSGHEKHESGTLATCFHPAPLFLSLSLSLPLASLPSWRKDSCLISSARIASITKALEDATTTTTTSLIERSKAQCCQKWSPCTLVAIHFIHYFTTNSMIIAKYISMLWTNKQ